MTRVTVRYDDATVRKFLLASVIWGIVGMLVGVIVAAQLAEPSLNFGPWLNFGRLRPLHTNAVIFAFVGNMLFAGVYYSTQRLTKNRMVDVLSDSSGNLSTRKPCRRCAISGAALIRPVNCWIRVGMIARTRSTAISSATSEMVTVAPTRDRPARCSRSATGSRK